MKKITDFFNAYGAVIITALLLLLFMKECSVGKRVKRMEKRQGERIEALACEVDSLSGAAVTATDLKIEGLKSEKRMIQSCDRKRFDLDRENQIDREIKELENNR